MESLNKIKEYLPFIEHLDNKEIEQLEQSILSKVFSKGEIISGNADSCTGMILVEKGDVRVSIISEDGRQITLFHVMEKEVCAMTASCVISQLTFDTIISAEEETTIWVIPPHVLEKLSESNIYVKAYMYELLTQRFSSVVWVMEQILFKGVDHRLASFLVSYYENTGKKEIVMTQEEIAVEINTAREVIARMLKQFASDGLVELKRGKMLSPIIAEIAEEHPEIKVCKVNVDEEMELASAFQIVSIPTVLAMENGEIKNKSIGLKSKEHLLSMF